MNETAKLATDKLSVSYGGRRTLHEVSLTIPSNQVVALIGASGSGKTTFLRALNRMHDLDPTCRVEGRVLLDGIDLYQPAGAIDVAALRRRVGMVKERPQPFPLSIFDNVAFGLRLTGQNDRRALGERVEESLRKVALWEEVKDRLAGSATSLSGGQIQRLCLARALAVAPEVLLMDEPASALDPIATARIEELIVELKERYTVVIVTHDMQQAGRVSDHTAFFHQGELVEFGATGQLLTFPRERRTEDYVTGRFG